MQAIRLLTPAVTFLLTALASAGPAILYVSENGDKRIAIYSMDEATGELTRTGAVDLPAAPGSLTIDPKHTHLYAALRPGNNFVALTLNPTTGELSDPVVSPADIDASYLQVDPTGNG